MEMSNAVCAACGHSIDAAAKLCPYCSANPLTGERLDTQAILQEIFRPRELSTSESVMEYARQRQGVVIGVAMAVLFLLLAGLHQFVSRRNDSAVSGEPAVPLTEIADVSQLNDESRRMPMPELDFPFEGNPQAMRTFIVEAGAVTPPEVIAAQQAAAAAKQPPAPAAQPQPQLQRPAPPPPQPQRR